MGVPYLSRSDGLFKERMRSREPLTPTTSRTWPTHKRSIKLVSLILSRGRGVIMWPYGPIRTSIATPEIQLRF